MIYLPGVGEVPISVSSGARRGAGHRPHDPVRRPGDPRDRQAAARARSSGCAGPTAAAGRSSRPAAATSCWWRAGWAWPRCGRPSRPCWPTATGTAGSSSSTERASRPTSSSPRNIPNGSGRAWSSSITVDHADATWHGQVGVVPILFDRLRIDPERTVVLDLRPGDPDAVRRHRGPQPTGRRRGTSTTRWSGTCSARWACAATASSGRRSSARTAPSSRTASSLRSFDQEIF